MTKWLSYQGRNEMCNISPKNEQVYWSFTVELLHLQFFILPSLGGATHFWLRIHSSVDVDEWVGNLHCTSAQVLWPSVTSLITDDTSSTLTRICCLLSLSRIVTEVVLSTVMAKGTPSSSVLAYRFPIDVPTKVKLVVAGWQLNV